MSFQGGLYRVRVEHLGTGKEWIGRVAASSDATAMDEAFAKIKRETDWKLPKKWHVQSVERVPSLAG